MVLGALVLLVLFVVAVGRTLEPTRAGAPAASIPAAPAPAAPAPAAPAPATEAPGARALLEGLGPGDEIAGWHIDRVRRVSGQRLAVDVFRGKTGFTVWIARKGAGKKLAPHQTDKYDFYFGDARTYGGPVPAGAFNKVMNALAQRVQRTESRVPVPPGL